MRELWYLCRVPNSVWPIIVLREGDYNYQRRHEMHLHVPNHENALVLLAKGTRQDMMLLKDCFIGELTNVS